ncbi:hypothetical protein GLOIN_2v1786107 [Rhizophagus clarus]|uniref:Crinkler effector protein N-terminal domain-containing protein n=1 Tax=Rhizophagus clarus TaxID=94130 RepID=A0A8H3QSJ5_9GLOM|nr:hypothetical protein GLOIN_2v1786107 [Rhizophagus clarus]
MSNYSSLFRVLSPSRVQTKFEEKSLPARYTDIMIFCLVQGDAIKNSFPIDTRNYATFGHLRSAIKDAKQNAFVEHKGVELHSFESVGSYFQETPTSTNIRIIVEPPPPATTGKRRWDFGDGNEDRDRKKVPETILTCAQKIMEDIKKLSENSKDYSNPENIFHCHFHSLMFDYVLDKILGLAIGDSFMDCFIYGTIGYGKSYILATIACFLLRTGKRVVYLPDCRELAKDPEDYIKLALILAYADNIEEINEISACKTTDDIVAFCKSSEPLYFIVDQMNALDYRNNTEIVEGKKVAILDVLNRMTSEHYYVKSSSANNESALYLIQKQTNDRRIELYGGFDEDEMSQWWMKNKENLPSVNEEQKKKIEHDTGKNPLFLSFLLGVKENFENHLNQLLKEKIKKPMTNFSEIIPRWDLHVKLMSSFLTNGYAPSGYGVEDYDHRYFYVANDDRTVPKGIHICRNQPIHTIPQLDVGNMDIFKNSSWVLCIKEFKNNPSVKGFMVEKACLASIWKNGLMANAINFKFDNYKFFTSIEEIDFSMNEGLCTFYLPRLWNQKSIDGLLTLYKKKNKKEKVDEDTLYIAPIQITLDKEKHSDSEASFFSGIWPELESKISGDLKVEVMFIWITRENDVDYFVEANKKILKERTIEINPQYTSIVKAFRCINNELEDILSY